MATSLPFSAPKLSTNLSIGEVRIGIVVSLWNGHITSKLLDGAVKTLGAFQETHPHQISFDIIKVPGAFEAHLCLHSPIFILVLWRRYSKK